MLQDAILKLQNEMTQNANDSYIKVIGEFLLQHLELNPGSAERIMAEGKTIKSSLSEMGKEAKKRKGNSGWCAVLTDQEGFDIVLKYFGIKPGQVIPVTPDVKSEARPAPIKPAANFDVQLEDLL